MGAVEAIIRFFYLIKKSGVSYVLQKEPSKKYIKEIIEKDVLGINVRRESCGEMNALYLVDLFIYFKQDNSFPFDKKINIS